MTTLNKTIMIGRLQGDLQQEDGPEGICFHGTIAVQRLSGETDFLPIHIPAALLDEEDPRDLCWCRVCVEGELISASRMLGGAPRHLTMLLARTLSFAEAPDAQSVTLEGAIVKKSSLRPTPSGREICDLVIAVRRGDDAAYIPIVTWGRTARRMQFASAGDTVLIEGRFQSRKYFKKLDSGGEVQRTAFEVSAKNCDVISTKRRLIAQ